MRRIVVLCCQLLVLGLAQGCQLSVQPIATPQLPDLGYTDNSTSFVVPQLEEMYRLTPEQIAELTQFTLREDIAFLPKQKQAYEFLKSRLVNFDFEGENYFASESLALGRGNCMALAMLTYAIARELDIQINFQVMHTMPILLDVSDKFAMTSDHVRSFLFQEVSEEQTTYLWQRDRIVIDYFPDRYDRGGKMIDEDEFFAMFYRNLAADSMMVGEFEYAHLLLKRALELAPDYAPAINMLAVASRQLSDDRLAEALYQYGLQVADEKVTLLSNYHVLLTKQGRDQEARQIKQQLLAYDDQRPYIWYLQAKDAMAINDFESAEVYLNKFLENTNYYHKAYFDLAKVQLQLGKPYKAKKRWILLLAIHLQAKTKVYMRQN